MRYRRTCRCPTAWTRLSTACIARSSKPASAPPKWPTSSRAAAPWCAGSCRRSPLAARPQLEAMNELGRPFALQVQCAFLGWPDAMERLLRAWFEKNQQAIREGNRQALEALAAEFTGYVQHLLGERRAMGDKAPDDITARLMRSQVQGRPLTDEEIVS